MKPFFVLCIAFIMATCILKLSTTAWHITLAGNVAMCVMLIFTSIGHFAYVKGMTLMLPPFIPYKRFVVYSTGVLEIVFAAGLLVPAFQTVTAYGLIVFFILILPCNIYAALNQVDYQNATNTGPGKFYLFFRIPFQIVIIVWVYIFNLYGPLAQVY